MPYVFLGIDNDGVSSARPNHISRIQFGKDVY